MISKDASGTLERIETVARYMDRAFRIPGTKIRFGWDSLAGLIPGLGDTATLLPSIYIIERSRRMGVPKQVLHKMIFNVGIDWFLGLVPLVGDLFDLGYKSNTRNAMMLRQHLENDASNGFAPVA